ncbi:MAG: hypothetical protein PVJ53_02490 [Desulfobacterales bacterium]|jgi:hypothetical protein
MKSRLLLRILVLLMIGVGMVAYRDACFTEKSLRVSLFVAQVELPAVPNAAQFTGLLGAGVLLDSFARLAVRRRSRMRLKTEKPLSNPIRPGALP